LASSDTVHLDGGNHFDTLLYDAAGRPITPGAPTLPDGSLALVGLARATLNYTNFESIPGFVGPTGNAGGTYTILEGQSLQLNGSARAATNTELLALSWDLNGDGVFGDAVDTSATFPTTSAASTPTVSWAQLEALGLTQGGNYTIAMQVTTTNGTFYGYTTLVIDTAPPVSTLHASESAHVGAPYAVAFAADFPGDEVATGWSVNWGDGTITPLPSDATTATHTYIFQGFYTVTASVTDAIATYTSAGQSV